jgi:hypothetical protein
MDGGFRYCAKLSLHRVPSHTLFIGKAQQSSATLDDQRAEERVIACQEVTIQRDTDTDSSNHLQIKAAKILSRLLKLINSVCVIYSVYVVVALYFSTPKALQTFSKGASRRTRDWSRTVYLYGVSPN